MPEPRDFAGEIWDALEAGDVDRALELASSTAPAADDGDAHLAIATAFLEGGHPIEAEQRLRGAAALALDGDQEYERMRLLAEATYLLGRPQEALDLLYVLEPQDRTEQAQLVWSRGLCFDHLEDRKRADACFREAASLDSKMFPAPIAISGGEMERIVKLARARLPKEIQQALEEVPVIIDDLPSQALIQNSRGSIDPDLLGLYTGPNLLERSVLDPGGLPPQIFLYRRNLERFARDREELVLEIEKTLLHELGHHLGYDEDDLDRLDLA